MIRPALRVKQKKVIKFGLANPYSILAMDPRLGKSFAALEIHRRRKLQNCAIICPGYMVENWRVEINKWYDDQIITVIKKGKDIYDVVDSDYVIVSYELCQKFPFLFEWAKTVIIDESHNLKNIAAKRTEFIHKHVFENSVPCVLQLTGSPIKNRVAEFYSLLALCFYNPKIGGPPFLDRFPSAIDFADYFSYRHEYEIDVGNKRVKICKWLGMKNIPELRTYLKDIYIRIKADENDLPPLVFIPVLIDDTPNPKLLEEFNLHFADEAKHSVKSNFKKEAAIAKAPITIQYVKNLLEKVETPVIVYSDHVESCEKIAAAFGVHALTGKVQNHKRMELAKRFQEGEGNVLCATVGALKEGVGLSRAKDIVLNDPAWVPGDLKQVYNRPRAVGEKDSVNVHTIFGSPQDQKIFEALTEKEKVIEGAT